MITMITANTVRMLSALMGLHCPEQPFLGSPSRTSPAPVVCQGFPDGPQVHVVTLSPVVSSASSPVSSSAAPGWTWLWFISNPVSEAADRPCCQPWSLLTPLSLDKQDKSLLKLQQDKFRITIKKIVTCS